MSTDALAPAHVRRVLDDRPEQTPATSHQESSNAARHRDATFVRAGASGRRAFCQESFGITGLSHAYLIRMSAFGRP